MADLQALKIYLTEELTPGRTWKANGNGGTGYCCPICHSGEGLSSDSDGALSVKPDGERWKCFSCGNGGDIYDLFSLRDGLTPSEATAAVVEKYDNAAHDFRQFAAPRRPQPMQAAAPATPRDFRPYNDACHKALTGSPGESYLTGRGLTPETLERFNLGYDAQRQNVVFPYPDAENGYWVRRPIAGKRIYYKPKTEEAGSEPLFNVGALYAGASAVFVVESQICAISIEQEGGKAVALGNSGGNRLIEQIKRKPTDAALIVCLDNDRNTDEEPHKHEQAEEKARNLTAALNAAGATAIQDNSICGSAKDPNDALQADAAAFRRAIAEAIARAAEAGQADTQAEEHAAALAAYMQENAAGALDGFGKAIVESYSATAIPTGFPSLDKMLGGGLFEGLYTLGAISSLGKTSFLLQVIDQIAEAGHDCIVFSLEMAKYELMAKSLSRLSFQYTRRNGIDKERAKTTRGITNGANYAHYSAQDFEVIQAAKEAYKARISPRVWIREGMGDIGVNDVRKAVERHIGLTGNRPVILIDYLQILAPYVDPMHLNRTLTDKQTVDKNVLELKRLSRDFKIPVICVSSFNRDNYSAPVNTAAFKESGAVEYSADALIGLQYTGMERQQKTNSKGNTSYEGDNDPERLGRIAQLFKDNDAKARRGEAVEIDVKILKNRNGARGMSDTMNFYPMFNLFEENTNGFKAVDEDMSGVFRPKGKAL